MTQFIPNDAFSAKIKITGYFLTRITVNYPRIFHEF